MKDDTISRAAALTALNGCTEIYLNNLPPTIYKEDAIKAVKAQPSATDTNVGGNLIDRQAAIDMLKNRWKKTRNYEGIGDDIAEECELYLKQVPSAQPEIIHCKDCKYNPNPPECGNAACVLFYGMTDQMGFCHHGERRERE